MLKCFKQNAYITIAKVLFGSFEFGSFVFV